MVKINDIIGCMREMAPEGLAEPWDNCGLIIATDKTYTQCVTVCLDINRAVVDSAVKAGSHLIISHHPLIFSPIKRIGGDGEQSQLIRALIKNDIAVYSAHTNVDKTYGGLNDLLAGIIGLEIPESGAAGAGGAEFAGTGEQLSYYRYGSLPYDYTVNEFHRHVCSRLKLTDLIVYAPPAQYVTGDKLNTYITKPIRNVVVMCGSYSLDLAAMAAFDADALLCGEIKYHDALDLTGTGLHIVQAGHHGTERFFINLAGKWIKEKYADVDILGVGFADSPAYFYHGESINGDV